MEIVDSQVHIWGPDTPQRPWRAGGHAHAQRATPVTAEEVVGWMDEGGVDAAIIVPPSWEGDRNDLALSAVERYPGRFAVMGRIDPSSRDVRGQLPSWKRQPGMLGVRLALHTPQLRQPFLDGDYDWMWQETERLEIPVMVLIHHAYMPMIDAIAAKHPRQRLVIDHLGLVNGEKDAVAFRGLDQLLALARRPNVAVKSSALPCYTDEQYPYAGLQPYLKRVYAAFGNRRMFWGTDQTRSPIGYRKGIELFTRHMPFLVESDLEWIMGKGIRQWLDWKE
ncbi:MAG TPA: amidohydrolase family protein [Usitatibacter sp.]|nr:amidohydrolase family protein [Usitatibacter sp.]